MSVRFSNLTTHFSRSSNVPAANAFSMLAWARQESDTNIEASLCGFDNGTDGLDAEFGPDGTTLRLYAYGSTANAASSPTLGKPFCIALKGAPGSGVNDYTMLWRHQDSSSWIVTTLSSSSSWTPTRIIVANYPPDARFGLSGDIWGFKLWDRTLSNDELLAESFYSAVKFPTSLNLHWPMRSASDTVDLSGNTRSPTITGSPTTSDETWLPWRAGSRVLRAFPGTSRTAAISSYHRMMGRL
jgi:hypothetical protein